VFGILGIGIGFCSVNLGFRGTFVVYIGIEWKKEGGFFWIQFFFSFRLLGSGPSGIPGSLDGFGWLTFVLTRQSMYVSTLTKLTLIYTLLFFPFKSDHSFWLFFYCLYWLTWDITWETERIWF
jgi:hypothetical protein